MNRISDKQVFTTKKLDPRESVRAWREYLADVYYKLDVFPQCEDYVHGTLIRRSFASMGVSNFEANAQRVIRSKAMARDDMAENYAFVFPTRGSFVYRQRGNEEVATPGHAYVVNTSEHYEVDLSNGASMVALVVPCDLIRNKIYGLDDLCSKSNFADPLIISTINHFSSDLLDINSNVSSGRIQDLCLNLIDLMISSKREVSKDWKHSAGFGDLLVDATRRCIRQHLSNPKLCVSDVADKCGVSKRYLQKILHDRGSTFGRELLEARLLRASQLLSSNQRPLMQIGQIAAECGFASQAHFATRYRERFGVCPRDSR